MNISIKFLFISLFFVSFQLSSFAQDKFGKTFSLEKTYTVDEVNSSKDELSKFDGIVVLGEISQVCQNAGCWIKLKSNQGNDLFVKFGEHDFTVPLDYSGRVFVHGKLIRKEVSVEEQKHLAKDGGKSKKEIKKIKNPKTEYRFVADGLQK